MKKTILGLFLLVSIGIAKVTNIKVTPKFIKSTKLKIIDIRTENEWRETGIVKGSYTITFFDDMGNYDIEEFLVALNRVIKHDEQFAIICRTGTRTAMISNFLGRKLDHDVINLKGGIIKLFKEGYKTQKYTPKK